MEGLCDDVLIHVVAQVTVESGADVLVDCLQLDKHQRQTVDEADKIGAAVIVWRAQAGQFQFAHSQKPIRTRLVLEVDNASARVAEVASGIAIGDRYAIADQAIEVLIVLQHRAAEVVDRERPHCVIDRSRRQVRVESLKRGSQIAGQHRLGRILAPERAGRPKGLVVEGIDALPAERLFEVLGKGRLHQPVLAVDGGERHVIGPLASALYGNFTIH
jgi:hypothetical protein